MLEKAINIPLKIALCRGNHRFNRTRLPRNLCPCSSRCGMRPLPGRGEQNAAPTIARYNLSLLSQHERENMLGKYLRSSWRHHQPNKVAIISAIIQPGTKLY